MENLPPQLQCITEFVMYCNVVQRYLVKHVKIAVMWYKTQSPLGPSFQCWAQHD